MRVGLPWFGIIYGFLLSGIIGIKRIAMGIDEFDVVVEFPCFACSVHDEKVVLLARREGERAKMKLELYREVAALSGGACSSSGGDRGETGVLVS